MMLKMLKYRRDPQQKRDFVGSAEAGRSFFRLCVKGDRLPGSCCKPGSVRCLPFLLSSSAVSETGHMLSEQTM